MTRTGTPWASHLTLSAARRPNWWTWPREAGFDFVGLRVVPATARGGAVPDERAGLAARRDAAAVEGTPGCTCGTSSSLTLDERVSRGAVAADPGDGRPARGHPPQCRRRRPRPGAPRRLAGRAHPRRGALRPGADPRTHHVPAGALDPPSRRPRPCRGLRRPARLPARPPVRRHRRRTAGAGAGVGAPRPAVRRPARRAARPAPPPRLPLGQSTDGSDLKLESRALRALPGRANCRSPTSWPRCRRVRRWCRGAVGVPRRTAGSAGVRAGGRAPGRTRCWPRPEC